MRERIIVALAVTLVACGGDSRSAAEPSAAEPSAAEPSAAGSSAAGSSVAGPLACVARWEGAAGARSIPVWGSSEEVALRRAQALARYLAMRDRFVEHVIGMHRSLEMAESPRLRLAPRPPAVTLGDCEPLSDAPTGEVLATATHPAGYRTQARAPSLDLALEAARRRACTSGFGALMGRTFSATATREPAQRQAIMAEGARAAVEEATRCWQRTPEWEATRSDAGSIDGPVVCRTSIAGPLPALEGGAPAIARGVGDGPDEARARERAYLDASTDVLAAVVQTMSAAIARLSPASQAMASARAVEAGVTALSLGPLFEARWTRCTQAEGPYRVVASHERCRMDAAELASLSVRASRCDQVSDAVADEAREALDGVSPALSRVASAGALAEQLGCMRGCRDVVPVSGPSLEPPASACGTREEAERSLRSGLDEPDLFDALRCLSGGTQRALVSALTEPGADPMQVFAGWREGIDPSRVEARETTTGWRLAPAAREASGGE